MERFVFPRIENMDLGMFSVTNMEYMRQDDLYRKKYRVILRTIQRLGRHCLRLGLF